MAVLGDVPGGELGLLIGSVFLILNAVLVVCPLWRLCRRVGVAPVVSALGVVPVLGYALLLVIVALAPRHPAPRERVSP